MSDLQRYRIDGEIGRGAMGVVYRAYDNTLDRVVALKELTLSGRGAGGQRDELVQRFVREARTAGRLNHPNVVAIYDVFAEGERYFIAMEFVEGETLADLVARGPLPPNAARLICAQMLAALGYAHRNGVVHRDIKPENVFVSGEGHVKVADFGVAKLMSSSTNMTQAGTVIGTPGYMAPEQIRGDAVDGRADLFAAGAVLYEMLTGCPPFDGDSPTTVMYRVINERPPAISIDLGDLAPVFEHVIARALAKDPAERYPSAEEMAAALAGQASTAPTVAFAPAVRSGRNRTVLVVGGVLVVLTLAALGFATLGGGGGGGGAAPAPAKVTEKLELVLETPADGKKMIAGEAIDIRAVVSAGTASSVAIMWNGTPIKTLSAAPYAFSYTPAAEGNAEIKAVATDAAGKTYESGVVHVTVSAKEPPKPAAAPAPAPAPAPPSASPASAFWTVILYSSESQSECEAVAQSARAAGLEADVLQTDEWSNLRPGYFAAYSGRFGSKSGAQAHYAEVKSRGQSRGGDTYPRFTGDWQGGD